MGELHHSKPSGQTGMNWKGAQGSPSPVWSPNRTRGSSKAWERAVFTSSHLRGQNPKG